MNSSSECPNFLVEARQLWVSAVPRPSSCFQQLLLLLPCGLLWLAAGPNLWILRRRQGEKVVRWSALAKARLICHLLMAAMALFDLGSDLYHASEYPPLLSFLSPGLLALTMFLSLLISELERRRQFVSSPVAFLFFILLLPATLLALYAAAIEGTETADTVFLLVIRIVSCTSNAILVVLFCFSNHDPHTSNLSKDVCGIATASYLSQLTFIWMTRLVVVSYKKGLEASDVFRLQFEDTVARNFEKFQRIWKQEARKTERVKMPVEDSEMFLKTRTLSESTPLLSSTTSSIGYSTAESSSPSSCERVNIFTVIFKAFGPAVLKAWVYKLAGDLLAFAGPFVMSLLIDFTADKSQPAWHGPFLAIGYFVVAMTGFMAINQNHSQAMVAGVQSRSALIAAIYRKGLRLSNAARANCPVGSIVNLMSVDAQRVCDLQEFLWFFWSCLLIITLCLVFLWFQLGVAVLASVLLLFAFLPFNVFIMIRMQNYLESEMKEKDKRLKLLTELLSGMKILKLYAWEPAFEERLGAQRGAELRYIRRFAALWAWVVVMWCILPFLVTLSGFVTYVLISPEALVSPEKIFVCITLFEMVRFPILMLPWGFSFSVNAFVSLRRINAFLCSEELNPSAKLQLPAEEGAPALQISNGSFSWASNSPAVLHSINLCIPCGHLAALVGKVGCGKSSLVSAVLGDMVKLKGDVTVRGSIAYVPQQAWIQHMSVQNNILFGQPMEPDWYEKVLDACCLRPDLQLLISGDQTLVGDRGVNLSGGQKQRISLARAVYQRADLYLLDDPLSAVDAHVAKELFDKVIGPSGLLANSARLLVTHGLHWLSDANCALLVTDDGRLEALSDLDPEALPSWLCAEEQEAVDKEEKEEVVKEELRRSRSRKEHREEVEQAAGGSSPDEEGEELVEEGDVGLGIYRTFLRARGYLLTAFMLLSSATFCGLMVLGNFFLSKWSEGPPLDVNGTATEPSNRYLGYYGITGISELIGIVGFAVAGWLSHIRSSTRLHENMLARILRAPMAFFDTTPIGRIVNRFSRDLEAVDRKLPPLVSDFMEAGNKSIFAVLVVCVATPYSLIIILPMIVFSYFLQRFYIPVSRQSRRLEAVSRSPIFTHFTESIVGASVIRAFGQRKRFRDTCDARVDENVRFYLTKFFSDRWFIFFLDFFCAMVILGAMLTAGLGRDLLSPSIVGLSISYALGLNLTFNWTLTRLAEIKTEVVAVERIQEYCEVDQEAPWDLSFTAPEPSWPSRGAVVLSDLNARYRPTLPLALRGVSASLRPGERVGIVGRTGAGKSSLSLALFRLIEASRGGIEIDGVNIASLGLHQLRSRLTILPQDPVLFSGSLRTNLDPLDQKDDAQLWSVLELAHLAAFVRSQPAGLGHEVGEGGANLSVGQRQLVCLARALLRRSRVLVLDEATAAVDVETDRLVMDTVREQFRDSTTLIIAHRLATILDTDRVMVLDEGRIRELDTPENLLRKKQGLFYRLALDAGVAKSSEL